MKTDKLFYELFRIQPNLILRLLPELPSDAGSYGFQAPVFEESEYRLDVLLEPQAGSQGLPLVILEAQMYSDPDFLLKLYAQSGCLLHQRLGRQRLSRRTRSRGRTSGGHAPPPPPRDWLAVVICPSRRMHFGDPQLVEEFLERRVRWIELQDCSDPQLQASLSWQALRLRDELLELILTLIPFILTQANTEELIKMLGLTIEEARQSRAIREFMEEGRAEGQLEGEGKVLLHQLARRCGLLTPHQQAAIEALGSDNRLALAEALLDFRGPEDLTAWLQEHGA